MVPNELKKKIKPKRKAKGLVVNRIIRPVDQHHAQPIDTHSCSCTLQDFLAD